MSDSYLAVLKAIYDYDAPQSEDEVAIKEDQLLLLLEKTDEDWWKVKVKSGSPDGDGPSGLVPSAYVEEVPHKEVVKALYDYEANASSELTVKEDQVLYSYEIDEGWMLVKSPDSGRVGYIPGNYVQALDGSEEIPNEEPEHEEPAASSPSPPLSPTQAVADTITQVSTLTTSNSAAAKSKADDIQTWSLSEVDKKGKKKKGTLGVGNGAVFFASTDKTPVQKWQITDVDAVRIEKGKQVVLEIRGANATVLRYHAGSKENAEAILKKIEKSIDIGTEGKEDHELVARAASPVSASSAQATAVRAQLPPIQTEVRDEGRKNGVHFASSPPAVIPRSDDGDEEDEGPPGAVIGTALYDFVAGGNDELTINEGDRLWVLDRTSEDWWTCRNSQGLEGVVPGSYIEVAADSAPAIGEEPNSPTESKEEEEEEDHLDRAKLDTPAIAEREEDERREREEQQEKEARASRLEQERARAEREKTAQAEKRRAEAAAVERKRKQREREEADARKKALQEEEEAKSRSDIQQDAAAPTKRERRKKEQQSGSSSRGESKNSGSKGPLPKNTRTWHDKTGQFSADAEFLGLREGKIRLHKSNGVVIEVPAAKMSPEDMEYVRRLLKKKGSTSNGRASRSTDEDDLPLAVVREGNKVSAEPSAVPKPVARKRNIAFDWFEFFLSAGCDIDECTRYAAAFERDKIDETLLSDIQESTMRSLGLKEGDIIRVKKAIGSRGETMLRAGHGGADQTQKQIEHDEVIARQLQAQEDEPNRQNSASPGAPNLFASPGGALMNNTRRGRPRPSKSAPPLNVDLDSISSASDNLTKRVSSPVFAVSPSPVSTPTVVPPKRSTSIVQTGFEDDAWTNRPSSTNPPLSSTPVPAVSQVAPAPAQSPKLADVQGPNAPHNVNAGPTAPKDTNFELLAKISQMRPAPTPPVAAPTPPLAVSTPPMASVSPFMGITTFTSGMGMASSPIASSQHLQAQPTGIYSSQLQASRSPIPPIAANQPLLNPLIPTQTGFNSFIPTRPVNNFAPPVPPLPSFNPILSGSFTNSPRPILPVATGMFPPANGFAYGPLPQPTGFGSFGGLNTNSALSPMQTGLPNAPPTFGSPFSVGTAQSPPPSTHSPANIFAQMKSGTFGQEDAPQSSDKYDALRMNSAPNMAPQQTGWGLQQGMGGYTGFVQR